MLELFDYETANAIFGSPDVTITFIERDLKSPLLRSGFKVHLPNQWTVSMMWGFGSYTENNSGREIVSADAEMAAWDINHKWFSFGSDTVSGWHSVGDAKEFIAKIKAMPATVKKAKKAKGL